MTTLTKEKKQFSLFAIMFGIVAYGSFMATINYHIAFLANFYVPITIDNANNGPLIISVIINVGLVALFGIQHTIMADPVFKKWITRFIPKSCERSLFVLVSSAVLALLMWQWRSIDTVLWQIDTAWLSWMIWGLYLTGWGIVFLSTFLIDHWHLFGLKQMLGRDYDGPARFVTPLLYKFVRHPMMTGMVIAMWATPLMTLGHAVFAVSMTFYILVGVRFEERKLVDELGPEYERYQKAVPPLFPTPGKKYNS